MELQNLPPIVALVLGFIGLAWLVLVFLVPFMIEGIRQSTRKTHEELAELNQKLDRLNNLLTQNRSSGSSAPGGEIRAPRGKTDDESRDEPRGRREPTISETAVPPASGRGSRREPIVR